MKILEAVGLLYLICGIFGSFTMKVSRDSLLDRLRLVLTSPPLMVWRVTDVLASWMKYGRWEAPSSHWALPTSSFRDRIAAVIGRSSDEDNSSDSSEERLGVTGWAKVVPWDDWPETDGYLAELRRALLEEGRDEL